MKSDYLQSAATRSLSTAASLFLLGIPWANHVSKNVQFDQKVQRDRFLTSGSHAYFSRQFKENIFDPFSSSTGRAEDKEEIQ
jgi:hypothetical protein